MSNKREQRVFTLDTLEVRTEGENGSDQPAIVGHAAVFNTWATIWDFREMILPGAFKRAIEEDDVRALWNHDSSYVLGRNTAGTLTLTEDEQGLLVNIIPPDTQWARDLLVSMQRGDINQMSIGFIVGSKENSQWVVNPEDGVWERTILSFDELWDVSPVTYPAYESTDAQVRAMGLYRPKPPQERGSDGSDDAQGSKIARVHRDHRLDLIERSM